MLKPPPQTDPSSGGRCRARYSTRLDQMGSSLERLLDRYGVLKETLEKMKKDV